ncbi:MAG: GTP-binding protein [Candidatus Hodarchaeota archaeon]
MEEDIITAVVYIELNDEIGPNPIDCLPADFSYENQMHISIKVITILSGEHGLIPESLVILPFPSLNLKGLIKYITWDDESRRGDIGQSAITVLFKDVDDVIFYKYKNNLELIFAETASKITMLEKSKADKKYITEELKILEKVILNILYELKVKETSTLDTEAFPEISRKISDFIDYKYKVILVGDPGVGKTSLILRFTKKAFRRRYIPTLGVVVSDRTFKIDNSVVQLVIWDIAGQVKFETMRRQFYLGTDAIFLVFDLTNSKSFDSIPRWYQDIEAQLKKTREIIGFVIGNKTDLINQKIIGFEQANNLANRLNLNYIETSALTGDNVEQAFYDIAKTLYESLKDDL